MLITINLTSRVDREGFVTSFIFKISIYPERKPYSVYVVDVFLFILQGSTAYNKFTIAQTPLPGSLQDFLSLIYHSTLACVISLDDGAYTRRVQFSLFLSGFCLVWLFCCVLGSFVCPFVLFCFNCFDFVVVVLLSVR